MKRVLLFLIFAVFSLSCMFSASQQWEYMVITFGETYFSDRNNLTLAYLDEGLNEGIKELEDLEENLNILGKHGWELVGITGTSGEDQQLSLKRLYDKTVSALEKREVNEAKKRIEDKKTTSTKTWKLQELDSIEAKENEKKMKEERTASLKNALKTSLKGSGLEVLKEEYSFVSEDSPIEVKLEILLPQRFLINGNSYRKSEVSEYSKENASLFELKEFEVNYTDVKVIFFLEFNGRKIEVYSTTYSYYVNQMKKGRWTQKEGVFIPPVFS